MITDYASLQEATAKWLERDGSSEFTDQVPLMVSLAEAWLRRQLVGYQREVTTTLSANSSGTVALPSDFIAIRGVAFGNVPYSYNISGSTLTIANGANRAFAVTYYERLPPLNDANPTNWLIETAPDVYFYACLAQGCSFEQDWQNGAIYEGKAQQALAELNLQNTVAQYGRTGLVLPRVAP